MASTENKQAQWEMYLDNLRNNASKAMAKIGEMRLNIAAETSIQDLAALLKEWARIERLRESVRASSSSAAGTVPAVFGSVSPTLLSTTVGAGALTEEEKKEFELSEEEKELSAAAVLSSSAASPSGAGRVIPVSVWMTSDSSTIAAKVLKQVKRYLPPGSTLAPHWIGGPAVASTTPGSATLVFVESGGARSAEAAVINKLLSTVAHSGADKRTTLVLMIQYIQYDVCVAPHIDAPVAAAGVLGVCVDRTTGELSSADANQETFKFIAQAIGHSPPHKYGRKKLQQNPLAASGAPIAAAPTLTEEEKEEFGLSEEELKEQEKEWRQAMTDRAKRKEQQKQTTSGAIEKKKEQLRGSSCEPYEIVLLEDFLKVHKEDIKSPTDMLHYLGKNLCSQKFKTDFLRDAMTPGAHQQSLIAVATSTTKPPTILGWLTWRVLGHRRQWVELVLLCVMESCRRQGIGDALIEKFLISARASEREALFVDDFADAPGLFQKHGFLGLYSNTDSHLRHWLDVQFEKEKRVYEADTKLTLEKRQRLQRDLSSLQDVLSEERLAIGGSHVSQGEGEIVVYDIVPEELRKKWYGEWYGAF